MCAEAIQHTVLSGRCYTVPNKAVHNSQHTATHALMYLRSTAQQSHGQDLSCQTGDTSGTRAERNHHQARCIYYSLLQPTAAVQHHPSTHRIVTYLACAVRMPELLKQPRARWEEEKRRRSVRRDSVKASASKQEGRLRSLMPVTHCPRCPNGTSFSAPFADDDQDSSLSCRQ